MITNIKLSSINESTGNFVPLGVAAGLELNNGGAGSAYQIQPVSLLGAVQGLNGATGMIAVTGSGTAQLRTITSVTTIGITNGDGVAGNPVLEVNDDTSTQRVIIGDAGSLAGTRPEINFIQGSNVTLTINDNSGANRVDVTIAAASAGGSSAVFFEQAVDLGVSYSTYVAAAAKGSFTLSTPSTNLLSLLTTGGAGILVVTFQVELNLLYTGSLPATIIFDLYTDANAPSGALVNHGSVRSDVSTIAGTTTVTISKPIADIYDAAATVLVIYVANPDATNGMTLQNFSVNTPVMYLPAGYN